MRYPGWTCAGALATGLLATSAIARVTERPATALSQWARTLLLRGGEHLRLKVLICTLPPL